MRNLILSLSRWTGWDRATVLSLGISEASHHVAAIQEANER